MQPEPLAASFPLGLGVEGACGEGGVTSGLGPEAGLLYSLASILVRESYINMAGVGFPPSPPLNSGGGKNPPPPLPSSEVISMRAKEALRQGRLSWRRRRLREERGAEFNLRFPGRRSGRAGSAGPGRGSRRQHLGERPGRPSAGPRGAGGLVPQEAAPARASDCRHPPQPAPGCGPEGGRKVWGPLRGPREKADGLFPRLIRKE